MIKLSQFRLAAVALALTAWLPLQANAGLLDDDEARRAILDLRAKVDALTRDINTRLDTKADKAIGVDMLNQHEQTMQEISRLRGQVEVLANEIANAQKNQKDLYADLDARIKKLEPRQETIDDSRIKWPALPEPVDGELAADRRAGDGSQADSREVTRPSSASTRVPGGQVPSLSVSTRVPFSRRIQRAGANLRAKTAIRGASSSSSLARACGSGTMLRSTPSPLP